MEVGKKYKHRHGKKTIYSCDQKTQTGYLISWWSDSDDVLKEGIITENEEHYYVEHKEPQKGTVWLNIYENIKGDYWSTCHKDKDVAKHFATQFKRLACVEVPWTEGEGL